jgi:hypothetical protein
MIGEQVMGTTQSERCLRQLMVKGRQSTTYDQPYKFIIRPRMSDEGVPL